ncbi:MAG: hypothetical protein ACD_22C00047G0018 [uncultured bacterium]|nr:MAG: hypothetical protein ACD_22C00047G0018 [uncultured bacterium]
MRTKVVLMLVAVAIGAGVLATVGYFYSWAAAEALGTGLASAVSLATLLFLYTQLKVEQEPYVVVYDDISRESGRGFRIKIRNVGRGSALGIVGCIAPAVARSNEAFFGNDQSHSKSLFAGEPSSWMIDEPRLQQLESQIDNGECYRTFYLFYKSQFGKTYRSRIKLKVINSDQCVVMDCERKEV